MKATPIEIQIDSLLDSVNQNGLPIEKAAEFMDRILKTFTQIGFQDHPRSLYALELDEECEILNRM